MKSRLFVFLSFSALVISLLSACNETIKGNGNVVERQYELDDFSKVDVSGVFEVELIKGKPELEVIIDENLHEHVSYRVEGGRLIIDTDDKFLDAEESILRIHYNDLSVLELSGASQVHAPQTIKSDRLMVEISGASELDLDVHVKNLDLELSGGGELVLSGKTGTMDIDVSGAATIKALALKAGVVEIEVTGAGEVETWVTDRLKVDITGAAEVNYLGQPDVEQKITGAGEVKQIDKAEL